MRLKSYFEFMQENITKKIYEKSVLDGQTAKRIADSFQLYLKFMLYDAMFERRSFRENIRTRPT